MCGLVLSPLLFNIYMRLLGEIIRHRRVRYYQCTDDTQMYIFVPGKLSTVVAVLSWFLEAVRVWMGNKKVQMNPGKTEWG